jgi:hypothetical protein
MGFFSRIEEHCSQRKKKLSPKDTIKDGWLHEYGVDKTGARVLRKLFWVLRRDHLVAYRDVKSCEKHSDSPARIFPLYDLAAGRDVRYLTTKKEKQMLLT